MGTDDLHHKRKSQTQRGLQRNKASRSPYSRVLIVSEGSKTEPSYFAGARAHYGINVANMQIRGDCGTDPVSVVEHGLKLYRQQPDREPYDRVYCVFDQDDKHAKYQQALDQIAHSKPAGEFAAITSVPCFEYWLLLHFTYSTASCAGTGGKSAGARMENALKVHWPEYRKNATDVFATLNARLDIAHANAIRARAYSIATNSINPSTRVHELVAYLQTLNPQKKN